MKYLALIQARCGSKRLPNKVMMPLAGKTVLERVVERVRRSKYLDEVIVVTSIAPNDLPLIENCARNGTRVFIGSEDDVLDRYYQCARLFQPEYVIRITADCPVIDWRYIDLAIQQIEPDSDYLGQFQETFPDGLDVEIVKHEALKRSWKEADMASAREHVTYHIRTNREEFRLQEFTCPIPGIARHRWTIDEEADYVLIKKIYDHFSSIQKYDFVTEDILDFLSENPDLQTINQGVMRNEGMTISLRNDKKVNIQE